MKQRLCQAVAIVALSATAAGGALAAESADNDALGIADAKFSLIQAVTAAEQHVGGKASSAEYEQQQDHSVFEVEVVNGQRVMDVQVDPSSGKVLATAEDTADDEDREAASGSEDDQD
jgi:uncharacterized membrane protein YkoI